MMDRVCTSNRDLCWGEVSIVLTDDDGIRNLNLEHLARYEATDVLCFLYDPMPGDRGRSTAEIIVNVQRAVEEGNHRETISVRNRRPWNRSRELALYLAHGCDHLTGANDTTRDKRAGMRRKELRWLKQAEACGLIDRLI